MAWEHLSITKPHLVYIILGGFTSIFMLVSLFVKEKLYIGEATVATICGVIFGPHAANLINPLSWGNTDLITLEFSRIVLVVQCFAVGVELPKAYMERHWRSVVFLLVPVMTFGWLITSLFVWWMIVPISWLESLIVAACVTATDPVLASSVVGKGKFAKRVPKHLRDVLSAESGCNDGMAFPFIYLSIYLLRYNLRGGPVVFHWICYTILYECIFGATYGVIVGYIGRRAIRMCERKGIIDRESFLVFYFVLALFCAGSGSLLGLDDLLVGFAAGVGFSNDGWFTEQTEESHVSNVIDLLLNLTYFVYFGTIIPWEQYNAVSHGLEPWRLVVIAIMVIFFRRIPAMLFCKPFIPDIKTWREALFAGHFGPIGVGAIFAAILARSELEHEESTPLARLPPPGSPDYNLMYLIWPVVTFLVIASILVHGSSIAVFTLGKRINTLTITLTYTTDTEKGPLWMQRLPRIGSQGKSMSRTSSLSADDEKEGLELPIGDDIHATAGLPKNFLRRVKEEDNKPGSRSSSLKPLKRRKKRKSWDPELGPNDPVSASAIKPARRSQPDLSRQGSKDDNGDQPSPDDVQDSAAPTPGGRSRSMSPSRPGGDAEVEAYDEGNHMIIEDEEGNVLDNMDTRNRPDEAKATEIDEIRKRLSKDQSGKYAKHKGESHRERTEGEEVERAAMHADQAPLTFRERLEGWKGFGKRGEERPEPPRKKSHAPERKRGPAHAYQFGNTIIVEDEDGEVIKKYTLPSAEGDDRKRTYGQDQIRRGITRMSTWVGLDRGQDRTQSTAPPPEPEVPVVPEEDEETKVKEERSSDEKKPEERPPMTTKKTERGRRRNEDNNSDEDDGLRMTISRTEQYGLTGLQRRREDTGRGSIALGSGRRLSTRDFLKQMQQLDAKSRIREVEESDAPEEVKQEVRRKVEKEERERRPDGRRTSTRQPQTPGGEVNTPGEQPKTPGGGDGDDYFSQPKSHQRPYVERMTTGGAMATPGEEIPTHDVRGALVRHGKGQTAADDRRRRLATIKSNEEGEHQEEEVGETAAERRRRLNAMGIGGGRDSSDRDRNRDRSEDDQGETIAERRRRLAAIGVGGADSSSDEDEEGPRRPKPGTKPVPEPGLEDDEPASPSRGMRVQWGGETGRQRGSSRGQADGGEGVREGMRRLATRFGRQK